MKTRVMVGAVMGLVSLVVGACSSGDDGGAPVSVAPPTFHADVEPLLQRRCQSCHHAAGEGGDTSAGLGPFSLLGYESAFKYASAIATQTTARSMPPFGARKTDECAPRLPFMDDVTLTDDEISMLRRWLDAGAPEGDPAKAPAPVALSSPPGLSTVTHTLKPAKPYEVVASRKDEFRCFVLDPGFTEDAWISGVDVVPQNSRVTHHVVVYVDEQRESLERVGGKVGDSYPCFGGPDLKDTNLLAAWAPGARAMDFGDRAAVKVKKGSLIVSQVHYHPLADSTESDQTALALNRLPKQPEWQAIVALIGNAESAKGQVKLLPGADDPGEPAFVIPAGARGHVEEMTFTFTPDILPTFVNLRLSTVGTHMHWVGRDMKITLERAEPDPAADLPAEECLLQTPSWDFNWQRGYRYDADFEKLPVIHTGDTLRMRCTYDNTMDNPFVRRALSDMHVSAPQEVKLGETTLDEMCLGAFIFLLKP